MVAIAWSSTMHQAGSASASVRWRHFARGSRSTWSLCLISRRTHRCPSGTTHSAPHTRAPSASRRLAPASRRSRTDAPTTRGAPSTSRVAALSCVFRSASAEAPTADRRSCRRRPTTTRSGTRSQRSMLRRLRPSGHGPPRGSTSRSCCRAVARRPTLPTASTCGRTISTRIPSRFCVRECSARPRSSWRISVASFVSMASAHVS
mmetsp:Transcript_9016/g.23190  ORF Transcript_9016/g.23190 Transcript_9016/m.23190 type:complete len:205 (+) Transcript_9016:152-766(+)